jgi:hypothetical protein
VTKRRGGCRFRLSNFMKRRWFRWTSSAGRGRNVDEPPLEKTDSPTQHGKKVKQQKHGKVVRYSSDTGIDCNAING